MNINLFRLLGPLRQGGASGETPGPELLSNQRVRPFSGSTQGNPPFAGETVVNAVFVDDAWCNNHYIEGMQFKNRDGTDGQMLMPPRPRAMSGVRLTADGAGFTGDKTAGALLASMGPDAAGNDTWGIEWDLRRYPRPVNRGDGDYIALNEAEAEGFRASLQGMRTRYFKRTGTTIPKLADNAKHYEQLLSDILVKSNGLEYATKQLIDRYNEIDESNPFPASPGAANIVDLERLKTAWVQRQTYLDRLSGDHYEVYRAAYPSAANGALGLGTRGHNRHNNPDAVNKKRIDDHLNMLWNVVNRTRAAFVRPVGCPPGQSEPHRYAGPATAEGPPPVRRDGKGTEMCITRALDIHEMWDLWQIIASLSDTLAAHYLQHLGGNMGLMPWINFPGFLRTFQGLDAPFIDPFRVGIAPLIDTPHNVPGGDQRPMVGLGADGKGVYPRWYDEAKHMNAPHKRRYHRSHNVPGQHDFNQRARGHAPGPPYLREPKLDFA